MLRSLATGVRMGWAAALTVVLAAAAVGGCTRSSTAPLPARQAPPPGVDLAALVAAYTARFSAGQPYQVPSDTARRAVADGVAAAVRGRLDEAGRILEPVGYRVRTYRDPADGRRFAEIADSSGSREHSRGWGRVYVDLGAAVTWSVQVPHPVFDIRSELLGAELFRRRPGAVLVLAGAHRKAGEDGSSDVAHRTDTVFHAVIAALTERHLPGIQVHGFDEASLPGREAVVSAGAGKPGDVARAVADNLEEQGFAVCRAWSERCGRLEGRTNVQGRLAADLGVPWIHVELANPLRVNAEDRAAAVGALARAWRG